MDNDIKVENKNSSRHEDVLLFLNEELRNLQSAEDVDAYNLEQEYAETKNHKSPFTIVVLLASILVVALAAFALTKVINARNENITVNLEEFNTLNLKSLLDSVSKVQTNYDEAVKNKVRLENKMELALKNAESKRDSDLYLVDSLNLRNKKDIVDRKQKINDEYEETVVQIHEEYESLILEAQKEIDEYSGQLNQYDSSKIEAAKEQEKALDSERQVQQMEKDRLSSQYESRIAELEQTLANDRKIHAEEMRKAMKELADKYQAEIDLLDPTLNDKKADGVINLYKASSDGKFAGLQLLSANDVDDETVRTGFEKFQYSYDYYKYMRTPIAAIPHKNSSPAYISTTDKLVDNMSKIFADTSLTLHNEKIELSNEITNLKADIEQLKSEHQKEVMELKQEALQNQANLRSDYEASLIGILAVAKSNAMVITADSDFVEVFVVPAARYLIEESTQIEIKGTKAVRGRLETTSNPGYYKVLPALDKNGEELPFDNSLVSSGNTVRILAK